MRQAPAARGRRIDFSDDRREVCLRTDFMRIACASLVGGGHIIVLIGLGQCGLTRRQCHRTDRHTILTDVHTGLASEATLALPDGVIERETEHMIDRRGVTADA